MLPRDNLHAHKMQFVLTARLLRGYLAVEGFLSQQESFFSLDGFPDFARRSLSCLASVVLKILDESPPPWINRRWSCIGTTAKIFTIETFV